MYWRRDHGIPAESRCLIMRAQELRIALAEGARLREELPKISSTKHQRLVGESACNYATCYRNPSVALALF